MLGLALLPSIWSALVNVLFALGNNVCYRIQFNVYKCQLGYFLNCCNRCHQGLIYIQRILSCVLPYWQFEVILYLIAFTEWWKVMLFIYTWQTRMAGKFIALRKQSLLDVLLKYIYNCSRYSLLYLLDWHNTRETFIIFALVHVRNGAHSCTQAEIRTTWNLLYPPTMLIPGIRLGSSGLVASAFIHWTISLAPTF